jgi:hypothetical protein
MEVEAEKRKKSLGELMKILVRSILMARRNIDSFRGQIIGDDGREIDVKQIKCNMWRKRWCCIVRFEYTLASTQHA